MRASWGTASSSRIAAASRIVAQSDWLPMMMPTCTVAPFCAICRPLPLSADYKDDRDRVLPPPRGILPPPGSGDDVGIEPVLDQRDPVLEAQLLLLEALERQRVAGALLLERRDRLVQVPVLAAELLELHAQHLVGLH